MNMKKVLFATDFSHLSDEALPQATALARDAGATLVIVHVEEPPTVYGEGAMYYGDLEPDQAALRAMLDKIVPTDPNVPCERHLLFGDPATELARFAKEENADLIVMATHGRTGLMRLLMGSVAEAVVRRAPCPVFTFKGKPAAETEAKS